MTSESNARVKLGITYTSCVIYAHCTAVGSKTCMIYTRRNAFVAYKIYN